MVARDVYTVPEVMAALLAAAAGRRRPVDLRLGLDTRTKAPRLR